LTHQFDQLRFAIAHIPSSRIGRAEINTQDVTLYRHDNSQTRSNEKCYLWSNGLGVKQQATWLSQLPHKEFGNTKKGQSFSDRPNTAVFFNRLTN
jgi:hypothetical protein